MTIDIEKNEKNQIIRQTYRKDNEIVKTLESEYNTQGKLSQERCYEGPQKKLDSSFQATYNQFGVAKEMHYTYPNGIKTLNYSHEYLYDEKGDFSGSISVEYKNNQPFSSREQRHITKNDKRIWRVEGYLYLNGKKVFARGYENIHEQTGDISRLDYRQVNGKKTLIRMENAPSYPNAEHHKIYLFKNNIIAYEMNHKDFCFKDMSGRPVPASVLKEWSVQTGYPLSIPFANHRAEKDLAERQAIALGKIQAIKTAGNKPKKSCPVLPLLIQKIQTK